MFFLDKASRREKDENGYLIVRNNPIAKAGVFQYLKSELFETDDNSIVNVYRDFEELKSMKDTFCNMPIVHLHQWVGEETNRVDGSIGSEVSIDEDNETLFADLIFYNPELVSAIENGDDVELSPAYTGDVKEENGRYNGQSYQYRQILGTANHLAVVPNGRAGKDLRIQDKNTILEKEKEMGKKVATAKNPMAKFLDSLKKFIDEEVETPEEEKKEKMSDSDILVKLSEVLSSDASEEDKITAIKELLADDVVEETTETEEMVEDEDMPEEKKAEEDNTAEKIGELITKAVEKEVGKFTDAKNKELKKISDSYAKVSQVVGSFDFSGMSSDEIYQFGYEALTGASLEKGLSGETAFLVASQNSKKQTFKDSAPSTKDSKILEMLKEF